MIGQGVVPLFTIAAAISLSDLTTTLCPDQNGAHRLVAWRTMKVSL